MSKFSQQIMTAEAATNGGPTTSIPGKLWEHPNPESTPMHQFVELVNQKHGMKLKTYRELYQWSINKPAAFWGEVWDFTGIQVSKRWDKVVDEDAHMYPRPNFFQGSLLNFAQNLLFPSVQVNPSSTAVIALTETHQQTLTWAQLRHRVHQCQNSLRSTLQPSDTKVIAGYLGNNANALIAMLAATSLGYAWTAVSTEIGPHAVLERLQQIAPAVLFVDEGSFYNGRVHSNGEKVAEIVRGLPGVRRVVVFPTEGMEGSGRVDVLGGVGVGYEEFLKEGENAAEREGWSELYFEQLPPDWPVYVLYSSGTTGAPKCIVHGSAGTLIQHKKEHLLHCSITPKSRVFYFTTTTWMMWHWLVSALASGATIVLHEGSPFRYKSPEDPSKSVPDDLAIPKLVEALGITHFGTSAKYLSILEQKGLFPRNTLDLSHLEAIYSTGSPLAPSTFSWVYQAFPSTINLGSITGGTDIVSLFGAPCPLAPVYVGEIQQAGLGMAIRVWEEDGTDVTDLGEEGDLVCTVPFPAQPVSFWGLNGAAKYRSSYFEQYPGRDRPVWHHGDFVRINPATGGLIMLGRSDGVLKPSGVRFGSSEIYNVILKRFPVEVSDALCIGRRRETDTDETVVLFLKMADDKLFTKELVDSIKGTIRKELSARHVPGIIDQCPEIPVTSNGKKVEGAVKKIISGLSVKTSASVANAECLDWYREWAGRN